MSGAGITWVETKGLVRDCGQTIDDVVFTVTVPDACPHTQGFWKNHEERWPVEGLTLGDRLYTQSELLDILRTPVRGDASVNFAHQLIAAKLNAANGAAAPNHVADAIDDADALLSGLLIPAQVCARTDLGQGMLAAKDTLDASYNNDAFTDTCDTDICEEQKPGRSHRLLRRGHHMKTGTDAHRNE